MCGAPPTAREPGTAALRASGAGEGAHAAGWEAAVLEGLDDGVLVLGPGSRLRWLNPAAERLLHVRAAEAAGADAAEALPALFTPELRRACVRALGAGEGAELEAHFPGLRGWLRVRVHPLPGGGCSVQLRDVSEARLGEQALRQSEEHFRALVENTADVVTVVSAGGMVRYESPSVERVLGFAREERIGRSLFEWVHPDDVGPVVAFLTSLAAEPGSAASAEYRARHRDGSWRVLLATGKNLLMEPAVAGVVCSYRDVTGEREAQKARAKLTEILETTADFVGTVDPRGHVRYLNRAARRMVGIGDEEDVSSVNVTDLHPQWANEVLVHEAFPAAARDGVWVGETAVLARDGREIPVYQVVIVHRSPSGAVEAISTTIRDLTEWKRAEEELRQSQKMEAVGRLAGGIAHDFNNLLTVIKGNAELVLLGQGAEAPDREEVEEIQRAAERAATLTRQLLAFSRKQILQPRLLSLNGVVAEIERILGRLIGADVAMTTDLHPALGMVRADPGQLEQVLLNLVVNARDAMPSGGRLVIATREAREEEVRGHAEAEPGRYVVLSVSDTGVGMDDRVRERVFEPFFTTKEPGKGTGLGLSTVYGIARQSGGFVRVESAPGAGSTFLVYLPRVQEPGAAEPDVQGARDFPRGTETVLLAEDEDSVRVLARRILERSGYTVLAASGGAEALELAARAGGAVDLLVTDVVMPEMSGTELAQRLRASHPGLRVLYMSGYTEDATVHHRVEGLPSAFLPKPFAPDTFVRRVREALDAGPSR